MVYEEFQKLIRRREKFVESSQENEFTLEEILAGIYNDPSHFIFEILQNAEDAKAKEVSFYLFDDHLEIKHDGKLFNIKDVDGITGIGKSTKKDDITSIGKFGVGFKSVFAITQTPIIHSGDYHFRIEDFVVPRIVENGNIDDTKIIIPFNHSLRSKKDVYGLISSKLENIGLKTILFLHNIEIINWKTNSNEGKYYKSTNKYDDFYSVKKVVVKAEIDNSYNEGEYLVFNAPVMINNKKQSVEIAYKLQNSEDGNEIIVKESESELVVFFPTEKETHLNFIIQGPYKTTANRENIPLADEQNQILLNETADLVAKSISIIKDMGMLDVSFLEVMPLNPNNLERKIYKQIYDRVKQKLLSDESLLPTSDVKYSTVKDSVLAGRRDLTEFLSNEDINVLFGKRHWLDTGITSDRTRELHAYLTDELDIPEIEFYDFAKNLTLEFLESKSDEWFKDFYRRLLGQRSLWEKGTYSSRAAVLREKPIIRTENNSHVAPFNEKGKIQVYLPSDTKSSYLTVKKTLIEDQDAKEFLEKLGLRKPDIFSEIREFILPKYDKKEIDIELSEYLDDMQKIIKAHETNDRTKKEELISDLRNLYLIHVKDTVEDSDIFLQPKDVYMNNDELHEYFKGFHSAKFVSGALLNHFTDSRELLDDLLIDLGCNGCPRRIEIESNLNFEDKLRMRKNSGFTEELYDRDYDYEGLDHFFSDLTKERSCILWRLLLKSIEGFDSWNKAKFFNAEYAWFYYHKHEADYNAKFLNTLMNSNWLFDKNGERMIPNQISLSELADEYFREDEAIDVLCRVLNFKLDDIRRIEENTGKKVLLLSNDEYDEYQKYIKSKTVEGSEDISGNDNEEQELNSWSPEFEPEEVEPSIEDAVITETDPPDRVSQLDSHNGLSISGTNNTGVTNIQTENDEIAENESKIDIANKKEIGRWGEKCVFKALKNKYAKLGTVNETDLGAKVTDNNMTVEIRWLNKNNDTGKGYDFAILVNGEPSQYIDVTSNSI